MNVTHRLFHPVTRALPLLLLAVTAAPPAAHAQAASQDPIALTLDAAVSRALETSHRVAEGAARVDQAKAAVDGRNAAAKPVVSVLAGYTRTNHVDEFGIQLPTGAMKIIYPDIPDNWRTRLDVQWPVYTSGRLSALERAVGADASAAEQDARTARADVRLDVTRAFWALHTARESVRVVEASLARVETHLKNVRTMKEAGLLAPNDVSSVEARRSREQMLLIEARNASDVAEADLRRAAGLPATARIDLVIPADDSPATLAEPAALLTEAKATRPERQALELRVRSITDRRIAAAAGLRPTVALAGGADYARPNTRIFPRTAEWNTSFDVGVNVSWNAWDGGRARADMAEADAGRRAAEERLAEFDRQLEFDVTQRRLDVASARAAVNAARDGARAAEDAHRVVNERFKAGLVGNMDVLDAQVALVQAQLDVTRAQAAVRLSIARLNRVLGH